jgi:hypothetical protein
MVAEDPEQYDVHADYMGGWPAVVTPVIMVREIGFVIY